MHIDMKYIENPCFACFNMHEFPQCSEIIPLSQQYSPNFSYQCILTVTNYIKYKLHYWPLKSINHYVNERHTSWSVTNHIISLQTCHYLLPIFFVIRFTYTHRHIVGLPLCLPVINPHKMLIKMGNWKRVPASVGGRATKKWKEMPKVKLK